MWWVEPATQAAGVAEAFFNALWLLLWMLPAAALIGMSGSGLGLVAAVILLLVALSVRFAFDLLMAKRERERATFAPWMLALRHEVAERTILAVIGWYFGLGALGGLSVLGVSERILMAVCAAMYVVTLLYVPASVARLNRTDGRSTGMTRRKAVRAPRG